MVGPIYVPVLPARRDAWDAYARLEFGIRRRVAPLWTVVPRVGPGRAPFPDPDTDQAELRRWLTPRMDNLIKAMEGLTGWVDAAHVEGLLDAFAVMLWRLMTSNRLRLVTGPGRDPAHQRYAADLAFLSGRGIGIRVLLDDPPDHPLSTDLLDLIDRLCLPPSRLDLILDAGPVVDGGDVGKRALAALDLLGASSLGTVVLTSGAFPRTLDHLDAQPTRVIQRHDWQLYRSVRAARPESLNSVVYGDYSGEHAPERGGRGRGAGMEQQAQIIAQGGATPQQEDALVASLTQKLDRARRIWGDSASLSAAEVRAALDGPANRGTPAPRA
ncbi:hypothetical protein [Streptomyces sp. NPDC005336]|uniref:beta family protein n=1 Tax=Streptomyces sp. NPDC005336 TaxID=3157035 RepID=UPI0033A72C3E